MNDKCLMIVLRTLFFFGLMSTLALVFLAAYLLGWTPSDSLAELQWLVLLAVSKAGCLAVALAANFVRAKTVMIGKTICRQ